MTIPPEKLNTIWSIALDAVASFENGCTGDHWESLIQELDAETVLDLVETYMVVLERYGKGAGGKS